MDNPEKYDLPTELERAPGGYRRPPRSSKKRGTLAAVSFCIAVAALLLLGAVVLKLLISFRKAGLTSRDISLAKTVILAAAVAAGAATVLALFTFFLRRQKKKLAVSGLILSVLVLAITVSAIYAYRYSFGSMNTDREFDVLSDDALHIKVPESNGEIIRQNGEPETTLSPETVEKNAKMDEVEWEPLTDTDLPEEAKEKMYTANPSSASYLLDGAEQISNFLLFGLDESGSSDSVILFSVDRVHHKIKMLSIARDSYVRIPAWGSYAKLAYAYNWGGPTWSVSTINHNFYLNVTDYIAVDTQQLATIIDYVGGVDVELNEAEAHYLRSFDGVQTGMCHLGGEAAVLYSRIRQSSWDDNEEKRTGRQREVLTSIMNSVLELPLTSYPEFIRTCLGSCTTSFDADDLMELAVEVVQNDYTIEQRALISQVDYWGGCLGQEQYFYLVYDLNRASDKIYRFVYEDLYISGYTE